MSRPRERKPDQAISESGSGLGDGADGGDGVFPALQLLLRDAVHPLQERVLEGGQEDGAQRQRKHKDHDSSSAAGPEAER